MYVVRSVVFHGQDEQEVVDMWNVNVRTVHEWVKRFKKKGLDGLNHKKGGLTGQTSGWLSYKTPHWGRRRLASSAVWTGSWTRPALRQQQLEAEEAEARALRRQQQQLDAEEVEARRRKRGFSVFMCNNAGWDVKIHRTTYTRR